MNQDNKDILVSISCITYNHAPYIRECLDGFMMQQTNFPFEVLIHDDASTDGTTEIIKEYEAKYPNIIKPLYEEENQWVKGRRGSAVFNFPRAQGKYIALCEGDDYWTDPLKLQKQVDFLESHPDYVMCTHVVDMYKQAERTQVKWSVQEAQEYDIEKLVYGPWIYHPLSVMFRLAAFHIDKYSRYKHSKDMTLFYHLLSSGKGYYMVDNMAVYRQHAAGVWSGINDEEKLISNFYYCKSLYEVERNNLALAYMCEILIKGYGRLHLMKHWRIALYVLACYTRQHGLTEGLHFLYHKYLLGKDIRPWTNL